MATWKMRYFMEHPVAWNGCSYIGDYRAERVWSVNARKQDERVNGYRELQAKRADIRSPRKARSPHART